MTVQRSLWQSLGPGILFSGAAIGNSHLVQSTRAGALFGLGLLIFILFANFIKYPAMRFGPQYAGATGESLVSAYRRLGRWVVGLFALSEVCVMAIIVAASALTTSAIAIAIFEFELDSRYLSILLMGAGSALLYFGGYRLLERITKFFVVVLTITTVVATMIAIPSLDWRVETLMPPPIDFATFAFIIALMGFMPATVSLSVVQSLWIVAKSDDLEQRMGFRQCLLDFNIGYIGTIMLAICFLIMGAGVLHSTGVTPAASGGAFAAQVISLYTSNLGAWSGVFVGASAMMVMFTTLVTLLDGFPRTLAVSTSAIMGGVGQVLPAADKSIAMRVASLIIITGAVIILLLFIKNFRDFIDFVTITAFVVAPLTAILNHIVITRDNVPKSMQPGPLLRCWSLIGIFFLSSLSVAYLWFWLQK